jgi:hypothetical protein
MMEERAAKPVIPATGDRGRYTMAMGRAAVARIRWHMPDADVRPDLAARYELLDYNTALAVAVLRLNEPVLTVRFDEIAHPLTGAAIDDFARAALAATEMQAA